MKRFLFLIYIFIIILLSFPSACTEGAKNGLLLWFNQLIPSIFPFIFISEILRSYGGIQWIAKYVGPFISKIFKCSRAGAYAVILGFLCGYPLGGKSISDLYEQDIISKNEANYLMTFCNNPSPIFIISYVAVNTLNQKAFVLPYLFITYISSLLTAHLLFPLFKKASNTSHQFSRNTELLNRTTVSMDTCIINSLITIQKIGVFMIIFSILTNLIVLLPIQWTMPKIILCGLIEQTNGIHLISKTPGIAYIKTALTALLTTFGGFAVAAQIKGVISSQGLSLKFYFLGKIVQTTIVGLLLFLINIK